MTSGVEIFKTAQQAREVLTHYGFIPLLAINGAEHWVNGPRRCILEYDGTIPEDVPLSASTFVRFVAIGNEAVAYFG